MSFGRWLRKVKLRVKDHCHCGGNRRSVTNARSYTFGVQIRMHSSQIKELFYKNNTQVYVTNKEITIIEQEQLTVSNSRVFNKELNWGSTD